MAIRKNYKPVIREEEGDFSGAALVGINSAVIGWNVEKDKRPDDLMGFAVRRSDYDPETGEMLERRWLNGLKRFPGMADDFGDEVRSDQAPFQRFRWSDYTLDPRLSYRYDVFPMIGQPGALQRADALVFNVRPSEHVVDGIGIYANRGVTSAKAYFNRFGNLHPEDVPNDNAYRWLERGMRKSLFDFLANAQAGESILLCIYEFFDQEIAEALKAAKIAGVTIRIVYHAKEGHHATEKSNKVLRDVGIKSCATPRENVGNLSHNKFMVHLDDQGQAIRLWTASANFSENAFYFQTNVALTFEDSELADAYLKFFELLEDDPVRGRKKAGFEFIRDKVAALNALVNAHPPQPMERILFSPVRDLHVVDTAVNLIAGAKSAMFLSAPFGVGHQIVDAIEANHSDILEYGLANSTAKKKIEGLLHNNTRFFTPAKLKIFRGETWDAKAFGAHKIHAKTLVVDPWGDDPVVLIGSANFSEGSCGDNDENTLLVRGDKRLAAIVATEFLRMYDHYKIRYWIGKDAEDGSLQFYDLDKSPSWSNIYFKKTSRSRKFRDRQVFAGQK